MAAPIQYDAFLPEAPFIQTPFTYDPSHVHRVQVKGSLVCIQQKAKGEPFSPTQLCISNLDACHSLTFEKANEVFLKGCALIVHAQTEKGECLKVFVNVPVESQEIPCQGMQIAAKRNFLVLGDPQRQCATIFKFNPAAKKYEPSQKIEMPWEKDQTLTMKGPYLHLNYGKKTWIEKEGQFQETKPLSEDPYQLLYSKKEVSVISCKATIPNLINADNMKAIISDPFGNTTLCSMKGSFQISLSIDQLRILTPPNNVQKLDEHAFVALKKNDLITTTSDTIFMSKRVAGKFEIQRKLASKANREYNDTFGKIALAKDWLFITFTNHPNDGSEESYVQCARKQSDGKFYPNNRLPYQKVEALGKEHLVTSLPTRVCTAMRDRTSLGYPLRKGEEVTYFIRKLKSE